MHEKLGLGTVQFGQPYGVSNAHGQVPAREAAAILNDAAKAGIRLLDTAANYGEAEAVLARLDTTMFRIVSKTAGLRQGLDAVIARARQSATLLKADTLLVHAAADLLGPDGDALWAALQSPARRRRIPQDRHLRLCGGRSGGTGRPLPARCDATSLQPAGPTVAGEWHLGAIGGIGRGNPRPLAVPAGPALSGHSAGKAAPCRSALARSGRNCATPASRRWRRRLVLSCRVRKSLLAWSASRPRRSWMRSSPPPANPCPISTGRSRVRRCVDAYAVALVRAPTTRRTSASAIAGNIGKVMI